METIEFQALHKDCRKRCKFLFYGGDELQLIKFIGKYPLPISCPVGWFIGKDSGGSQAFSPDEFFNYFEEIKGELYFIAGTAKRAQTNPFQIKT
jgi:hypothetical protein